jgi:hypothetical protein
VRSLVEVAFIQFETPTLRLGQWYYQASQVPCPSGSRKKTSWARFEVIPRSNVFIGPLATMIGSVHSLIWTVVSKLARSNRMPTQSLNRNIWKKEVLLMVWCGISMAGIAAYDTDTQYYAQISRLSIVSWKAWFTHLAADARANGRNKSAVGSLVVQRRFKTNGLRKQPNQIALLCRDQLQVDFLQVGPPHKPFSLMGGCQARKRTPYSRSRLHNSRQ